MYPPAVRCSFERVGYVSMRLLDRVDPPQHHGEDLYRLGDWFTWSVEARELLTRIASDLARFAEPTLVHISSGVEAYDYSYSYEGVQLDSAVDGAFDAVVRALKRLKLGPRAYFLTKMQDDKIDGLAIHVFLTLTRDAFVRSAGDPWSAIYAPTAEVGPSVGRFPLHCDLYRASGLLNIYDKVPTDGSGKILLLPFEGFNLAMHATRSLPAKIEAEIRAYLTTNLVRDSWNDLYSLIYGSGTGFERTPHVWSEELNAEMLSRSTMLSPRTGEGYLVNDRLWLHGRGAPSGGVFENRMRRLVFTSKT
jgi:hypothetical protein